nr:putative ribonuclease H-like domain-containing protein [Tanacetum cinerariifolium]
MLRDNALVELRKKFEKVEKERDELKLTLEKFQTSLKNLSKLLESQITDKTSLGYDNKVFNSTVFAYDELNSFESDDIVPTSPVHDRHVVPIAVLTRFRLVPLNATRPVTTAVPQTTVKNQRLVKHVVNTAHPPITRPINHRQAPKHRNFHKIVTTIKVNQVNAVKGTKGNWVWKPKCTILDHVSRLTSASMTLKQFDYTDAIGRSNGCSRHITGNISYLSNFEEINGGYVAFAGNPKGGKIKGKGKIRTGKLDFDDVYFVKELKLNLFSVSHMCDKKNSVLFTDTKCVVLSSDFKLPDENHVLLRYLRETNMYNVDLKNVVPSGDLTCLFTKATLDESNLCHRRLGHINFKTMNKLVKAKQVVNKPHSPIRRTINHNESPKTSNFHQKVTTVKAKQGNPQHALNDKGVIDSGCSRHMTENISYLSDFEEINGGYVDYGENPKGGKIIGKCKITGKLDFDDVYFLKELKFNLLSVLQMRDKKNNVLFTDTECIVLSSDFQLLDDNHVLLRVPRENNMYNVDLKNIVPLGDLTCLFAKSTLDESNLWHRRIGHINFKIMNKLVKGNLVRGLPSKVFKNNHTCVACKKGKQHRAFYSLLPIPFWAKAVNTACYVQNRVLVTKLYTMTHYELLLGRTPNIGFMRPFGCPVTILNTLDPLVKFDGKVDEGFLVGYSVSSKDFRVFNSRTKIVQETLHINFLENQPNVSGSGPTWLFNNDTFTQSMNYQSVVAGNQPNSSEGIQEHFDAGKTGEGNVQQYVLFPLWSTGSKDPQNTVADTTFEVKEPESTVHVSPSSRVKDLSDNFEEFSDNSTNGVNAAGTPVTAVEPNSTNNTNTFTTAGPSNNVVSSNFEFDGKSSFVDPSQYHDDPDMPALEDINYSDDEEDVGAETDFSNLETNITVSRIPISRVHKYYLVTQIIGDLSLAPQTRSMTRMVKYQGGLTHINDEDFHTCMFACFLSQEEPKRVHQALKDPSWIEAMQEELLQFKMQKVWVLMDLPKGFEDPDYPYKVYKALYGLHQAPRAWYETLTNYLLENGFQRGKIDQTLFIKRQKGNILLVQVYVDDIIFGSTIKELCKAFEKLINDKFQMSSMGELSFFLRLQVKQKENRIFISQDKYVAEILRKFGLTDGKSASTPIDTEKTLLKDPDGEDVDVHTVTPKASHLHAVKRIFRYLKGKPHLGLWYPKDSPFNLVAYSDSDYAGASLDRKSTTGGCHFLGCRLISWQCKKQTVVATSSTEAEYVAAASYCAKVLWIQNQLLDYGVKTSQRWKFEDQRPHGGGRPKDKKWVTSGQNH